MAAAAPRPAAAHGSKRAPEAGEGADEAGGGWRPSGGYGLVDCPEHWLRWNFGQCFGDRDAAEDFSEADVLSAVEFDPTGEYLATGDKGGRVVVFKRAPADADAEAVSFHRATPRLAAQGREQPRCAPEGAAPGGGRGRARRGAAPVALARKAGDPMVSLLLPAARRRRLPAPRGSPLPIRVSALSCAWEPCWRCCWERSRPAGVTRRPCSERLAQPRHAAAQLVQAPPPRAGGPGARSSSTRAARKLACANWRVPPALPASARRRTPLWTSPA